MATPRTDRSAGVNIAAAAVFLGSGFFLVMSLLTVAGGFVLRRLPPSAAGMPPVGNLTGALAIAVVIYLCLSIWGIATGIGLLRLRAWARASVLVFGGLMVLTAVSGAIGISVVGPLMPSRPGAPPFSAVRNMVLAIMAVPAVVGVWWLIYFNLGSVREQFAEYATMGHYAAQDGSAQTLFLRPQRPIGVTLIAFLYLMALPILVVASFRPYSAALFGALITGSAARAIYWLYAVVCLYVGIGLLKLHPPARLLAIGLSIFHLASQAWFLLLPDSTLRMEQLMDSLPVPLPPPLTVAKLMPLVKFGMVFGFLFAFVVLWVLIRSKDAFSAPAGQVSA